MKPERTQVHSKQGAPKAQIPSQEDAGLWEALGRSRPATAPDDFLEKVLSRVNELEAPAAARPGLAERWDDFCAGLASRTGLGLRLAAGLAVVALLALALTWQGQAPTAARGGGVAGTGEVIVAPLEDEPAGDTYAALDDPSAEMETILQLDDYLALADGPWLEPSDASFLQ